MASDPVPTGAEISRPPAGSFREIVSAGFVTTLLFAAFLVFPIVGALALPFLAVPAVRLAHRRGGGAGVSAALLSASLSSAWASTGGAGAALGGALLCRGRDGPPLCRGGAAGIRSSRAYTALCVRCRLITVGLALRPTAGEGQ
jgi:hypothetical protein